ncbi:hypothetical protein BESB_043750 [Besnoitia besnoiti]|uniref:XRN2-binding (XTBD) domain-containing protein n=1 Tax=Besnoitia besnoiti TaxID=94643 RepID=A0A2A9MKH6_BESBE|nr:hypothetical protein BESB_043750 [Besnoitia besnoiti]PFH36183.1 hypothetical protein BESB_043750 [Besnoitia besnoiti]
MESSSDISPAVRAESDACSSTCAASRGPSPSSCASSASGDAAGGPAAASAETRPPTLSALTALDSSGSPRAEPQSDQTARASPSAAAAAGKAGEKETVVEDGSGPSPAQETGLGASELETCADTNTPSVAKVMTRMQWESEQQCLHRQRFLRKVIEDHERRLGRVDLGELELFSALYFNVKFLQCTYDRHLLERMRAYEPDLGVSHQRKNQDREDLVVS